MIPQLPADKANHHMYGTWAAGVGGFAARSVGLHGYVGAATATVVVAAAKEIYDLVTGRGHPEWADFLATCVGGVPVAAAFAAVEV